MKIVHLALNGAVTPGFNYQENNLSKFNYLDGHDTYILASKWIYNQEGVLVYDERDAYVYEGVKYFRFDIKGKNDYGRRLKRFAGVYRKLCEIQPDILFCHSCSFVDTKVVAKYMKKHPGTKLFVDNHADFSNSARNFLSRTVLHKIIWRHYAQKLVPYAEKFFGVLPARVDFLRDVYKIPQNKLELLVMGADDEIVEETKKASKDDLKEKFGIADNDFLIVTGGKIDAAKTQTLLLMDAVKKLGRADVKLIVFGSVSEELKDEFNRRLDDGIRYAGWLNSRDSYRYFDMADLVVFPGRHSVYWEQVVGLGKPMIVKHWAGTTHVDIGGNVRFLYDDSVDEIYGILKELVENGEELERMRQSAENGMKFFSYRAISRRYIGEDA